MNDKKFFNKDLPKKCEYCAEAKPISGGKEYFCMKNGLVAPFDSCRKYVYDPLKRKPQGKIMGRDFDPEDLKL